MVSKRKFKRDYIILEAKDMNFRYKERVLPKAFAKVEINEEKAVYIMGNDYQKIWRHNKVGVKRKVNFLFEAYSACTYLIDPRIW